MNLCLKNFLGGAGLLILLALLLSVAGSIYYFMALIQLLEVSSLWSLPTTLFVPHIMINQKLTALAQAMSEYEGWSPLKNQLSFGGGPSVAYRNHNPGNLRSSIFQLGVRDGFAVFYNDATGFFAMCYDIMMKAQGKTSTGLNGNSTIRELIAKWSAGTPEAVDKYTAFVCSRTGLTPETKLEKLIK